MDIRRLTPDDAHLFSPLRLRALREEPMSFSSNADEQAKPDVDFVGKRIAPSVDSFVLGAFDDGGELVGIVGVHRQMPAKHAHKAFMWGMYVRPSHRGRGIGRELVEAAIRQAATLPGIEVLCTSVFLSAPAARAPSPSALNPPA